MRFLSGSMPLDLMPASKASPQSRDSCDSVPLPKIYAEALILARALRSSKRRCFLSRRTLKRSKSVRPFRLAICSRFLAQLVSFHLASTPDFSQAR